MSKPGAALMAALVLFGPAVALGQFRPPPMSPAQRQVLKGDEARAEAAKLSAQGDQKGSKEKLEDAAEAYASALKSDPGSLAAAVGLGQALGALRKWDDLVTTLRPMAERHPEDVDLAFSLGQALLKQGKLEDARPLLEVAGNSPRTDVVLVHYYLGWLALNAGDGARASKELTRYLTDRPPEMAGADAQVQELLGRAWLLSSDAPRARKAYESALAANPSSLTAQLGIEAVLELEGRRPEAISLLQGLVVRHPTAVEPRERLAWLLLAEGKPAEAEKLAHAVAAARGGKAPGALMGSIKLAQNALPEAEALLRQAAEELPALSSTVAALARAIQLQGRDAEAVKVLERAVAQRPQDVVLLSALGSTQRRGGNARQALETHKQVLALRPQDAQALKLVAADQFALEAWDEAIASYDAAAQRAPADPSITYWTVQALLQRAKTSFKSLNPDDGVADLRRAHQLLPGPQTARALGGGLLTAARFEDAEAVLTEAAVAPGASWQEQHLLGYARLLRQNADGAAKAFEAARGLATTDEERGQIDAGWALAELQQGKVDAAVNRLAGTPAGAANLPMAYLQRALHKSAAGDAVTAAKDLEAAEKLLKGETAARVRLLLELARGTVRLEQGRFTDAQQAFGRALGGKDEQAERLLVQAYVEYRRGRAYQARRLLGQVKKAGLADEVAALTRAVAQRELETWYRKGDMAKAERALKETGDARSGWFVHNRACVDYRRGKVKLALAAWEKLAPAVPESALNLGLHAHVKDKDARRAVDWYGRYLGRGSAYAGLVREWRERLELLYGLTNSSAQEGGQ